MGTPLLSEDPYGDGWLFTAHVTELGAVLSAEAYRTAHTARAWKEPELDCSPP